MIKYKETGLLEGLDNEEEQKIVSKIIEEGFKFEELYYLENTYKPFTMSFIVRVYHDNKKSFRGKKDLDVRKIVSYLYDKMPFLDNLDFLSNLDVEAEFYGLLSRDFLKSKY